MSRKLTILKEAGKCINVKLSSLADCVSTDCKSNILPVDVLAEPDIGDACGLLSHQVNVRIQNGGVDGLAELSQHCCPATCRQTHVQQRTLTLVLKTRIGSPRNHRTLLQREREIHRKVTNYSCCGEKSSKNII